ncbi:MAG: hypothetical protein mread185_000147 [Mycoplasmataceae bacterium]|nr:MAG: hypothetical protein mread185_000147 [Mycoplasmataceae bacterium]
MSYEITAQDFCLIVKNPKCQGTETENGKAEEGHAKCGHCKGNYFVGGECNYGGRHKMADELRDINQNFRVFDVLVKQQVKLSKIQNESEFNNSKKILLNSFQSLKEKCEQNNGESFFLGKCVGLDGTQNAFSERLKETFKRLAKELGYYMDQINKSTWQQLAGFQEKLKKLDKLNSESTQLAKEWKEEKDPAKKKKLLSLLNQKNNEIKSLQREIQKDPIYSLYSQEKSEELADIVKNIFRGDENSSFFTWNKQEKDETEEKQSDKYFGLLPKESTNNVLLLLGGLLIIGVVYHFLIKKLD